MARQPAQQHSTWFVVVVAVFVTCLIVANIISVKLVTIFGITFDAGTIIFPVSYICGDVLTEVYGFRHARQAIWIGFGCNLLAVAAIMVGLALPAAGFWEGQAAYATILGFSQRLLFASFCAYLVGEFVNSAVLARLKVATGGRRLWARTISSTVVGQGLDSVIFTLIAFTGVIPTGALVATILTQWIFKSVYEALATPLTYAVVNYLKRHEGVDVYDADTSFNPLALG